MGGVLAGARERLLACRLDDIHIQINNNNIRETPNEGTTH